MIKEQMQCPVCGAMITFNRNPNCQEMYVACGACGASHHWPHVHSEHIGSYSRSDRPRRVLVCGKGTSLRHWRNVPDIDEYICCNEAIEVVGRGIFTRYDSNTELAYCEHLPTDVTIIVPRHNKDLYNRGYWFDWSDLGMVSGPTGVMAIYLAEWLGATEIILIGFDAMQNGDESYYVSNDRNRALGLKDQTKQFELISGVIQDKLSYWDGGAWERLATDELEMEERLIDAIPYCARHQQVGVVHVSKFAAHKASVVCIVGKGPSAEKWRDVDADVFITINDAAYLLDRACYAVRGDGNTLDHRFMEWLPAHVTPIMPARLRKVYNYGWWFTWSDIGLDTICLTTLMAIRLAHHLFHAERIICCGLDGLHGGSPEYHPLIANERNKAIGHRDQRPRVRTLEPEIYIKCQHWNGKELVCV